EPVLQYPPHDCGQSICRPSRLTRFDARRQQLSIGARRTKSEPMKLPFYQKNSASWSRRQLFCSFYLQTGALDEPCQSIERVGVGSGYCRLDRPTTYLTKSS